jgi:dipeptidyl aminopeptidase/acylaminoacyl peptidase
MLHVVFRRGRTVGLIVLAAVVAALVAGTLVARVGHAQPAPFTASYVYLRTNGDTLGVETITSGASTVDGVLTMKGQPRVEWSQSQQKGLPGTLGMKVFAAGAAADAAPLQSGSVDIRGDSAYVDFGTATQRTKQAIATKTGAFPLVNASVLHASLFAAYARNSQRSTLDMFLTSGAQTLPVTIKLVGDTSVFSLGGAEMRIVFAPDGWPQAVTLPGQGARVVRAAGPVTLSPAASAPIKHNYDAPATAPYIAEHVRIPTGRGYELAATLTHPKGVAKAPVVVTISGSGPQERDSEISIVPGYAIFREIADTLGRRGIAVLRWDDRGVGESGGRESAAKGTSADVADDVRSIVAWLRTRSDIDGARVALAGHSEGGMVAPMVAATDNALKGIALMAGTAYKGRAIMLYQNKQSIEASNLSRKQKDSVLATVPAQLDSLAKTSPWIAYFMTYDPIATAKKVKTPVLVLQGMTDQQVSPEQADKLVAAFKAGGNRDVTLRKLPATNHLFLNDPSGSPRTYADLKDTKVRREALGALADWAVRVLK